MNNTTTPKNQSKYIWIEELRIIAAFAIVLLHIASTKVKSTSLLYEDCFLPLSFYHTITRFAVNCFIMISGALLLRPEKELTISTLIKKYIARVVAIFAAWSAVYVVVDVIKAVSKGSDISFSGLCSDFVYGHYHLWYLYMLAGLYLITPFLKELVKHKQLMEYFFVLCIIFYLLPNTLQLWSPAYKFTQTITNSKMIFHFVRGYVVYYIMGYYLTHYKLKNCFRYIIYIGGFLGIVYGIIFGILFSRWGGATTQVPYNNNTVNIFLFSCAVFLFFAEIRSKKVHTERKTKFITFLGAQTLGVYVMHPLFVDYISSKMMARLDYQYLWMALPILAIVIFVACTVITAILRKIPLIGKHIA